MSNFKPKKTGLFPVIVEKTNIDICGENLITFSIDSDLKNMNYVISKENFKKYINKLEQLMFSKNIITLKETIAILEKEIYIVYKTKVSQKRLPQILLNILVVEKFLYSDNAVDYEVKGTKKDLTLIIRKYS